MEEVIILQNYKRYFSYSIPICLLLIIYVYILSINLLSPLFADDYFYYYQLETGEPISGFYDVLRSQYQHYFTWGGRSVAHTFVQEFLYLGKISFSFMNAFMFVLLLLLIFWHSQGKNISLKFHSGILTLILLFLWLSLPRFGETVIWLTGACNYLWTTTLVLFFLFPYSLKFSGYKAFQKIPIPLSIFSMFLGGIVCGWTNENTALTMLLAICLAIYYFWRYNSLELWTISGLAGAVIGYLLLIFAPGNYIRLAVFTHQENYSFFHDHVLAGFKTIMRLTEYQIPIWILLFILFRILRKYLGNKKIDFKAMTIRFGNDFIYSMVCIGLSLFNSIVMLGSPTFPQRAGFASAVFLIVGVMSLFRIEVIRNSIFDGKGKKIIIALICFIIMPTAFFVFNQYKVLHGENQQREEFIMLNKSKGINDLNVMPFSINTKSSLGHVFISDITDDPNEERNRGYARYWGVKTIKLVSEKPSK